MKLRERVDNLTSQVEDLTESVANLWLENELLKGRIDVRGGTKRDELKKWLTARLPGPVDKITADAERAGFGSSYIKTVKAEMGIITYRKDKQWWWML